MYVPRLYYPESISLLIVTFYTKTGSNLVEGIYLFSTKEIFYNKNNRWIFKVVSRHPKPSSVCLNFY